MKISVSLAASTRPMFKGVTKKDRKGVAHLLNGLRIDAARALLNGESLPEFDLCQITVPGTNLYCEGNRGVPRSMMPQLKGFPIEGSPASMLEVDKNGKVDISRLFLARLQEQDIKTKRYRMCPTDLKATQNQLVGAKIALRVGQMLDNPDHKKFSMPYFISRDGYILDGHHGWASILSYCLIEKKTIKMNVIEVDMKIKKLVALANAFMSEMGIEIKQGT